MRKSMETISIHQKYNHLVTIKNKPVGYRLAYFPINNDETELPGNGILITIQFP